MDAAQLFERLGVSGVLFALVAWGIKQGLSILDRRLSDIADRVSKTAESHQANISDLTKNHREEVQAIAEINLHKIEALANAHRDAVINMSERMERLTERVIAKR